MNHLEHEKSPYLLQHADNPVDWYPWCEEALARAKQENKPIFLSIGYSTCHWCHVMEHESFTDQTVAEKLNSNYISIKVDREERPDLDGIYMQACHLMNGQGGWPLNLFLCPDGRPFYAMTYAPPKGSGQRPGFADILEKIAEIWQQQPEKLAEAGNQLAKAVIENEHANDREELKPLILETAARQYRDIYDERNGGFGRAPKFPQPHNLSLLLRLGQRFSDPELTSMALQTLSNIARGGITDQLGGGMHRYSVDDRWLVPHFEKMLYDQALIADAYLDAWLATRDSQYSDAARHILDYCLRELYHDQGGFYCGEDADSEGAEGTFYLWSKAEIEGLLSASEYQAFSAYFQISEAGNFEGKNILYASRTLAEAANECGRPQYRTLDLLNAAQKKLLASRASRPRPHLDDKILTGWNGLMLATLARAGRLLGEDSYLQAALQSTDFIADHLIIDGSLKRRYRAGESDINAFHEDYAFLIYGLTEIFLSTGKTKYIDLAKSLMEQCIAFFSDGEGGFFDAAEPFAAALGRGRTKQDGAIPAGASVTAFNLIRLAQLTGQPILEQQGQQLLEKHLPKAGHFPTAFAFLLQTLDLALSEPWLLIIVTPPGQHHLTSRWLAVITAFRPAMMTLVTDDSGSLGKVIPSAAGKYRIDGKTTAWLCSGNACQAPINEPDILERFLEAHLPLKTFNR